MKHPNSAKKNILKYIILVASFFGATTFFSSCEEPIIENPGILPPTDNLDLFRTDTFDIESRTVREDPLVSDELPLSILGSMNDPVFGVTCAGLYTEIRLPQANLNLGTDPVLDSVVLIFRVGEIYGPSTEPTDLRVFELDEDLDIEEDYFSNAEFSTIKPEIGTLTNFIPKFSTNDTTIRIRLSDDFGNRLISYSGTGFFTTTDSFQQALKGFFITVNENKIGDGLATIIPDNGTSGLRLYYSRDTTTGLKVDFPIDNSTARSNWYFHQYTAPPGWSGNYLVNDFINRQSKTGDSIIFIQSMGGTKALIEINGYERLANVGINKAELIFNVIDDLSNEDFDPATRLLVFRINDEGESLSTFDLIAEPSGHLDGFIRDEKINGTDVSQYRVNISRYFQRVLNGEIPNNGLYLVNFSGAFEANRVILAGATHSSLPIKLEVTYTKLD
ncbi:MAG: DUF4270 domain-containing protein [Chitinophagales bacterium]|nr:DUF4270 domain-containing protein [Chitinophagales bacterium]